MACVRVVNWHVLHCVYAVPCSCQLFVYIRCVVLCALSFPVAAAAVVVLSILSCRQNVAACVVFTVVLLKTAVMSQHLRRVVVVAASVLGVREAMAVVWSLAAVVPGEASVRSFTVQKTSVDATVVVLVYRPWRQAVDVSAAVEVVVCFPLPVFVVPHCGRWPASRFHFWCSCRFRSNVKVPFSVTSLSCRSLA